MDEPIVPNDLLASASRVNLNKEASDAIPAAVPPQIQKMDFRFHGQGGEYFRIWIVNLALSILTLSIYSAWAKVRTLRYFWGNTELAGARFDFHGRPLAMLIGRLVMTLFVVAYVVLSEVSPPAALVLMLLLFIASPWLVWRSMKFRLGNTSYRNIRFGFDGSLGQAYKYLLWVPLLTLVSFGFAFPFVQQRMARYLVGNVRFGNARMTSGASVKDFYLVYLFAFAALMVLGSVVGVLFGIAFSVGAIAFGPDLKNMDHTTLVLLLAVGGMLYALVLCCYMLIGKVCTTMIQQRIWDKADLAGQHFSCAMKPWPAAKLHLGNFVLLLFTLGFAWPWVRVRIARFRINNLSLYAHDGLAGIKAVAAPAGGAVGEEMAEMFDYDFSL